MLNDDVDGMTSTWVKSVRIDLALDQASHGLKPCTLSRRIHVKRHMQLHRAATFDLFDSHTSADAASNAP
jgi:hypothetical protein